MKYFLGFALLYLSISAYAKDSAIVAVEGFELERYLGKWYEIARLDNRFERGMNNNTAEYSLRDDGGINVLNRGYRVDKRKWKKAKGKAYFVEDTQTAHLKVSFFWPFYGPYIVFGLDKDEYSYAFVAGDNDKYLWLLARSPSVDQHVIDTFTSQAQALGFETKDLIFVEHDRSDLP